ncbi:MAG TPA: acyltransferase [Allosphingosinicella sp.]|nr:acyltransferase [Allosphingosinicella sp.]
MASSTTTARASAGPALPRLHNIQYLRAIAALGVVIFHAGYEAGLRLGFGALGVDIFFVVSGFLMVSITDAASRPWPFLRQRILRVAPLYWLATAVAFLRYGAAANGSGSAAQSLAASILFIPWGPPQGAPWFFPILAVGWTLNFEMLFYALFAASLLVPRRWQLPALATMFAGLAGLWTTRYGGLLPWRFWGHPIIFEFLAGAVLATAWRSHGKLALSLALAGLIGATAILGAVTDYPIRVLPMGIAALMVTGAVLLERRRPPVRALTLIGDASYSIYLWHYLAIGAAKSVNPFVLPAGLVFILYAAAGVTVGIAAHLLLERPLLKAIRSRLWVRGVPNPGGV